jgi:uncharacterized LabA/DUF88 family protein
LLAQWWLISSQEVLCISWFLFGGLMKRIMIFIDGSNLYHGAKAILGDAKLDFEKLIEKLVNFDRDRELVRTYYYNAVLDMKDDENAYKAQQRFFHRLSFIPNFEVKLGRLEKHGDKKVEKGVDVEIATDMLFFAYQDLYDVAIPISGDGDFAGVIKKVKNLGKHVENAYFFVNRSYHLQKVSDRFLKLDDFINDCLQ